MTTNALQRAEFALSHNAHRRYQRCPHSWYLRAVVGLTSKRGESSPEQDRGKIFHAMLEHTWREWACARVFDWSGSAGEEAARSISEQLWRDEGTDVAEETMHELLAAIRYHAPRLNVTEWEVVTLDGDPLIEMDVYAEVGEGDDRFLAHAIVDLVVRHRETGEVWLRDWKTTQKPIDATEPAYLEYEPQLCLQREILRARGVVVDFAALSHLRSVAPQKPEVTTRGKLTRDRNKVACDWDTYVAALADNGEYVTDAHLDLRDHLNATTFARSRVDISTPTARARLLSELSVTAASMRGFIEDLRANEPTAHTYGVMRLPMLLDETHTRAPCNKCAYQAWCRSELRDGKPDLALLSTHYQIDHTSAWHPSTLAPLANPTMPRTSDDVYLAWARERGRNIQTASQEFK